MKYIYYTEESKDAVIKFIKELYRKPYNAIDDSSDIIKIIRKDDSLFLINPDNYIVTETNQYGFTTLNQEEFEELKKVEGELHFNLDENLLKKNGFRLLPNNGHAYWCYTKDLINEISFQVTYRLDNKDLAIEVIDFDFGQYYDYQYILSNNPGAEFPNKIKKLVEDEMERLQELGIISGYIKGMYL